MTIRDCMTWLRQPQDAASLIAFRILFGLLMFGGVARFAAKGWIDALYIAPAYHFKFLGFSWIDVWPRWGLYVHFAGLGVLALLITAGIFYRFSVILFFLGFTYIELLDKTTYLNHYYLVSIVAALLAFMPLHRGVTQVPRWCILTLRGQLGLVYFFAGVAKLQPDWLLRAEPMSTWLLARADVPFLGALFVLPATAFLFSIAGAAFDLTIPFWLSWRKSRLLAYGAVVVFHVLTGILFNLGMFPWIMIALTTIFFDPSWPRQLLRLRAWMPVRLTPAPTTMAQQLGFCLLALHFLFQVLIPLRHHIYPGNRLWTNDGFRFAWHVMVVEKTGTVRYRVTDQQSGKSWHVSPREELTPLQEKMMATQPDMILEYAHHLADRFHQQGHEEVAVYADSYVALNGRTSRRFISPTVDLSREPATLRPTNWLLHLDADH